MTGSLNAFQKISDRQEPTAGGRAIYNIGVVYAHPQNPHATWQKARFISTWFTRIPRARWPNRLRSGLAYLNETDATKQEIERTKLEAREV